ncbi:hypothetical protein TNCV_841041 [Trichonephila clavipes]|nr:hypothetical protein TNCV_841041 [Trichonephila clavipes]
MKAPLFPGKPRGNAFPNFYSCKYLFLLSLPWKEDVGKLAFSSFRVPSVPTPLPSNAVSNVKGKESLGDSMMSFKYRGPQVSRVQLRALACHYVHGGVQRVALTPWRLCDALFTRCLRLSFSHLDP